MIEELLEPLKQEFSGRVRYYLNDKRFTLTTPLLDRHRDYICVHVVHRDGVTNIFEEGAGSELLQDTPEWVDVILNAGGCIRTFEGIGRDDVKDEDLAKALYELALCAAQISWGIHAEQHIKEDQ